MARHPEKPLPETIGVVRPAIEQSGVWKNNAQPTPEQAQAAAIDWAVRGHTINGEIISDETRQKLESMGFGHRINDR